MGCTAPLITAAPTPTASASTDEAVLASVIVGTRRFVKPMEPVLTVKRACPLLPDAVLTQTPTTAQRQGKKLQVCSQICTIL